nr:zinc finger, CCHC-type [Tanacetum cinerariifolium]
MKQLRRMGYQDESVYASPETIYQGIPEDLLLSLAEKQTAKDAWETLKTMFMRAERVKTAKVQTLKAEFETLSMKDTEIIDDFGMKVNNIVSNIRALGEKVEEAYVFKKLLRVVSSKFLQIASTIEQFADLDNMTVEEVIRRLKAHEERVRGQSENGEGKLLLTHQEWLERSKKKEEEAEEEVIIPIVVDAVVVVPIKIRMEDEDLQNPRKERNHDANLTQKDDEPALLLSVRHEVNEETLKEICDKNLVHGLKAIKKPDALCKGCLEGKQTPNPYPTQTLYKAKERLELIHADICGPISPQHLLKFHVLVENKTGVKVKTLRTDRMGEFNSKAFTEYCDDTGLKHHFMAPYSIQQNGVVERRNLLVIEMARSMMKSMEVPDTLWGEAKPEHLRVFGCVAHSKVLRGHQQKIDSRSEMLVYLGTETGSKAYHLLDPVSERIQVSRDVRFDEGYSQEDTILEDENDPTDKPLESFEGINDEEFQPTPQTHIHGDDGLSTPTQSPVTSVDSTSPASSTTGGGAPKRYCLLTDIYEECDELLFMQDVDEPTSYLTASKDREWVKAMKVHHLDLKSAFLNGWPEEEVYVTQPEGYVKANHPEKVYKQSKALYGLRQASRAWNSRLDKCLKGLNFKRCRLEYGVYIRKQHGNVLIVGVYVDDLIVTGSCDGDVKYFKEQMNKEFEMSDMGLLSYYLGIEAGTAYCNPSKSPMEHKEELTKDGGGVPVNATLFYSIIGGLRYLAHTRPAIAYAVGIVSRFMEKPTAKHMQAVKRILRYIKGTINYGLVYTKYHKGDLITGYSDNNHARDMEDRWSIGGNLFYLKENLVTWCSKKQQCVALSSCEAEFMAATTATCQEIWVSRLVHEITGKKAGPFVLYLDNKSAIELIKNMVFHERSKHIDLRYHFIRECVERGDVVIKHVCSKEQKADILTKPLPRI